jgi:hypothetical protein
MGKMGDLSNRGVTDILSYNVGRSDEKDEVSKLLKDKAAEVLSDSLTNTQYSWHDVVDVIVTLLKESK